jgi:AraC-like DNA-binding protein
MVLKTSTIASSVLNTDRVSPRQRFALWRDALSSTHEARLPDDSDPTRFRAFARGWNLGTALVIETRATAQVLSRTPAAIRADQADHYIIRLQRGGRWRGEADGRAADAEASGVMVLDMARTTTAQGTDIDNINVLLPRDALDALLPPFDMHGMPLHGAMAVLLRNHLAALVETLPHIPREYAPELAQATCRLVAACLAPSRERAAHAQAPLSLARLTAIRRYIDRHLTSPALTPDAICKALGLSRSTLYAACEARGGVAAFIRRRRLERVHALLSDPRERRRISDIAYQHGFVSKAHFSRAFRHAFGVSPREARGGAPPAPGDAGHNGSAYETWIRQLGG